MLCILWPIYYAYFAVVITYERSPYLPLAFKLYFTLLFQHFHYILDFPIWEYYSSIREKSWDSLCILKENISSEEGEPLTEREKRYQRRSHIIFDYTNDKEDKGKTHLSGCEDEEKEFPKILLRAMK